MHEIRSSQDVATNFAMFSPRMVRHTNTECDRANFRLNIQGKTVTECRNFLSNYTASYSRSLPPPILFFVEDFIADLAEQQKCESESERSPN